VCDVCVCSATVGISYWRKYSIINSIIHSILHIIYIWIRRRPFVILKRCHELSRDNTTCGTPQYNNNIIVPSRLPQYHVIIIHCLAVFVGRYLVGCTELKMWRFTTVLTWQRWKFWRTAGFTLSLIYLREYTDTGWMDHSHPVHLQWNRTFYLPLILFFFLILFK